MRAVTIPEPGGPEQLVLAEVPDPEAAAGEVVIEVAATAVNRADLLQRQGTYPAPAGAPPYPGLECSGRISALGPGVTGWRIGDAVCALLAGGGYAERVAVPAGQLLPVPAGVDLVEAATLPEAACTVWSNLIHHGRLCPGETLLVHGGGSGIGTFATQLGTALGATVLVTARGLKHEALRALGASTAIDYTAQDFPKAVRAATGGRGADVILDIIGAAYLDRNIDTLAPDGRLVIIGLQGGRRAEMNLSALLVKRASIIATTLRARPPAQKAAIVERVRAEVWPLLETGRIRPVVDRRFPLGQVSEAHRLVERNAHLGKVLLVLDED
ncbi:MAG: NAD(P)H-quinone oxidoreductase [Dactylosporangium sp.]|nr:NAD(P)H-quinone oxidoreductase [Dactylosporangium sp.]NNJ63525.1 NAD(P)H-quinone oxidoreductase [Dactylosporangium sp.]